MQNICYVPVSIGELFDKYTILEIKEEKIKDEQKLQHVKREKLYLKTFIDNYDANSDVMYYDLIKELKDINQKLWDIEDKIREKENEKVFDAEFIDLARMVYITNDKRSDVKNKINLFFNSEIMDIKSYQKYNNNII